MKCHNVCGFTESGSGYRHRKRVLTEPSSAETVLHPCMHNQLWMPSLVAHDSLELLESSLGCRNKKRTPQEDPKRSQVHLVKNKQEKDKIGTKPD
nr:hypothetical protein [Tanacetum cinerariifolium]